MNCFDIVDNWRDSNKFYTGFDHSIILDNIDFYNILYINIRSLRHKLIDVEILMKSLSCKIDIVVLTETWLNKNENLITNLDGFQPFHSNRYSGNYGGCSIFVRNTVHSSLVYEECYENNNFIVVKLNELELNIVGIYRPPSADIGNFLDKFNQIIGKFSKVIVIGDFNINLLANDNSTTIYKQSVLSYGYSILNKVDVEFATRQTNSASTIIDHVVTNVYDLKYEFYLGDFSLSDHKAILFRFKRNLPKTCADKTIIKKIIRYDQIINSDIWLKVDEIETVENLINFIKDILRKNTYTIQVNNGNNGKHPWINKQIRELIKQRERFYRYKMKYPNDNYIVSQYKFYVISVKAKISEAMENYYNKLFSNCLGKPKELWGHLNQVIFNKSKIGMEAKLKIGNITLLDPKTIAEQLNKYFVNITSDVTKQMSDPIENDFQSSYQITDPFLFHETNKEEVGHIINGLKSNSSSGIDGISSKLIKICKINLSQCISNLFNKSLSAKMFPNEFKTSRVVPVPKLPGSIEISNNRPISIPTALSKIFEEIINKRLNSFLDKNNIINSNQFGFCQKSNTLAACLNFTDFVSKAIDKKKYVSCVILDLSKAFDLVNHKILLWKLKNLGISKNYIDFFTTYFENRQQTVNVGNCYSSVKQISIGIPQGSVLAPTFFKIFINDVFLLPLMGKIQLFADDIIIMYENFDLNELYTNMQADLNTLEVFMCQHKLILNCSKTKYIIFDNKRTDPTTNLQNYLRYGNMNIEETKSFNYLGLVVDSKLKWNQHIEKIQNIILPYIFALHRTKAILPKTILIQIYNAYILSQLIYLNPIWSGAAQYLTTRLYMLQKRAIKNVLNLPIRTHTATVFQSSQFLCLSDIIERELLLIAYKVKNRLIKNTFELTKISDVHNYETRRNSLFRTDHFATQSSHNNVIYRCLNKFNKLPYELRHETKISIYKAKISDFVNSYKIN